MPLRISVALCTYNGQPHLLQQLASLAAQSRLPDELIVEDDGSTDDTVQILNTFAMTAAFPVKVTANQQTVGPAKNFERAIARCSGDVISFCDQDDIWLPDKLGIIAQAFTANPQLGLFFSDANVCNERCEPLGYRLWSSVGFNRSMQRRLARGRAFDVILRQNIVTGATMAFARRFIPLVLPIDSLWMHDGWIALLVAAFAPATVEPRPLIQYRQHPQQSVGATRRSLYQQYLNARKMDRTVFAQQAAMYQAVIDRLTAAGETTGHLPQEYLQRLAEKIRHCQTRSAIRLRQQPRVLPSLTELFLLRYRRFSLGWKSFAQDLFL